MIKKNNQTIGFIYKNNQNIDKIYKNNQLLFEQGFVREDSGNVPLSTTHQAIGKNLKDYKIYGNSVQGKLPDIYQQVEYIESTGTQYIDTGIKLNQDSKIITEIQLTNDGSQPNAMFGSRTSSTENNFECVSSSSSSVGIRIDFQSYETNRLTTQFNNEKNYILISKTLMQIGEHTKRQISYTDFETPSNCYIFYVSGESIYGQKARMKLYNFKIYQNDVLIKDFIPCYKKINNEIGLYDLVSNTFFTNAGTGTFNKGADTPTPSNPIEIESVGDLITDTNDINYGKYKIPVIVGNTTTNIYLDEPLRKVGDYSDYIDFKNQKEFRNVIVNDDTGTQTIENSYTGTTDSSGTSISLPNIPTIKGTTIFEIDTEIQPSSMYIKYKGK